MKYSKLKLLASILLFFVITSCVDRPALSESSDVVIDVAEKFITENYPKFLIKNSDISFQDYGSEVLVIFTPKYEYNKFDKDDRLLLPLDGDIGVIIDKKTLSIVNYYSRGRY